MRTILILDCESIRHEIWRRFLTCHAVISIVLSIEQAKKKLFQNFDAIVVDVDVHKNHEEVIIFIKTIAMQFVSRPIVLIFKELENPTQFLEAGCTHLVRRDLLVDNLEEILKSSNRQTVSQPI